MFRGVYFLSVLSLGLTIKGWEPCGEPSGCYCEAPILHEIRCLNVSRFPSFDENIKPGVLVVTFSKSPIREVLPFDENEWNSLKYLSFANTDNLSCETIAALQRPGLRIYSECISCCLPAKVQTPLSKRGLSNKTIMVVASLVVLGASVCALVFGYLIYRSKGCATGSVDRLNQSERVEN